ncbi:MAG: hypothetical protein ABI601_05975 [bacterium]
MTIRATYPAKLLAPHRRSPGVAIQQSFAFSVSKSLGTSNPAGYPPPPNTTVIGQTPGAGTPGSRSRDALKE